MSLFLFFFHGSFAAKSWPRRTSKQATKEKEINPRTCTYTDIPNKPPIAFFFVRCWHWGPFIKALFLVSLFCLGVFCEKDLTFDRSGREEDERRCSQAGHGRLLDVAVVVTINCYSVNFYLISIFLGGKPENSNHAQYTTGLWTDYVLFLAAQRSYFRPRRRGKGEWRNFDSLISCK